MLGLLVALLAVLVGLGWVRVARADSSAATTTVQQAAEVPDTDHGNGLPAPAAESDDDDCDEDSAAPSHFTFSIHFPPSTFDPIQPSGIQPSPGHRTGPEKPPRA
jgi:hypothetical protein